MKLNIGKVNNISKEGLNKILGVTPLPGKMDYLNDVGSRDVSILDTQINNSQHYQEKETVLLAAHQTSALYKEATFTELLSEVVKNTTIKNVSFSALETSYDRDDIFRDVPLTLDSIKGAYGLTLFTGAWDSSTTSFNISELEDYWSADTTSGTMSVKRSDIPLYYLDSEGNIRYDSEGNPMMIDPYRLVHPLEVVLKAVGVAIEQVVAGNRYLMLGKVSVDSGCLEVHLGGRVVDEIWGDVPLFIYKVDAKTSEPLEFIGVRDFTGTLEWLKVYTLIPQLLATSVHTAALTATASVVKII